MAQILIVDDSPTEIHVLKTMLEKNGFQTISATSGEEGVEVATKEKPSRRPVLFPRMPRRRIFRL